MFRLYALEILIQLDWGTAQELAFFKNSPGNSNMQPGLKTTPL